MQVFFVCGGMADLVGGFVCFGVVGGWGVGTP